MGRQLALFLLLLCIGRFCSANPKITVNIESEAVLSDIVEVKAEASSDAGITRVEFSVNDQLRATVTKPPYAYRWDTIDEEEGSHTLIVSAYDGRGRASSRRIKVEVDNNFSLGVKAHAEKAHALFRRGDFEGASLAGRKAYRVNRFDIDAIRAMAAAVGGQGDFNRALDLLERPPMENNQVIGDPTRFPLADRAAMELRGLFRIRRAATQTTAHAMIADLAVAYDLGKQLIEKTTDEIRSRHPESDRSPANLMALGDALVLNGKFEQAHALYRQIPIADEAGVAARHRIAYALVKLGRVREAEILLLGMVNGGEGNNATRAMLGWVYLIQRRFAAARDISERPAQQRSLVGLIVHGHACLALRDFRRAGDSLLKAAELSDLPEVSYLAACYFTDTGDLKRATDLLLLTIGFLSTDLDLYALRGFQVAAMVPNDGFRQAQVFFDFVLQRDPQNRAARLGKGMTLIHHKQFKAAQPLLANLSRDDKNAADVWMALAAAYAGSSNEQRLANEALEMAKRLDATRFGAVMIPKMSELITRVVPYRRAPLLTPALLAAEESGR
jgi:thioredoxin-like negative regulator of GroEL